MNNGWIKLYRKSKDNPLMLDANAWMVFSWLMLTVDRDSGEMSIGRFWASEYFRLKPTTFYKILKRLEKKYKVVTLTSNNKFTIVRLLNWDKYQSTEITVTQDSNNKVTTKGQQSNNKVTHIQDIENKELRIEKGITPPFKKMSYLINLPLADVQELNVKYVCTDRQIKAKAEQLYDYCHSHGKVYRDYKAFLRNALAKDFGERIPQYNAVPQDLPELSEDQRLKNISMIEEMKKKIFKN